MASLRYAPTAGNCAVHACMMISDEVACVCDCAANQVLNTSTLTNVGRGLVAAGSILLPVVLQLVPDTSVTDTACGLSPRQVATVQAAMLGHPAGCLYDNVTLGEVLAMSLGSSKPDSGNDG